MPNLPRYIFGVLFACLFPSLLTWIYFVGLAHEASSAQQIVYAIGKILQFTFPLLFLALILKRKIQFSFKFSFQVFIGLLFGVGVACLMFGLFNSPLFSGDALANLQAAVQAKVSGLGVDSLGKYLALGIFYALFHSLLEEYYWRSFVYAQLREKLTAGSAILISSLAFAAHHFILLYVLLGGENPLTYLFTLAIAIGGAFWAWQYEQSKSLTPGWLSHLVVDAGIFWIGYELIGL